MRKITGKKKVLPGTASDLMLAMRPPPAEPKPCGFSKLAGRDYVTAYETAEHELYRKSTRANFPDKDSQSHCALSEVDTMTLGTNLTTVTCEESSSIYKRYDFNQYKSKQYLLVHKKREEILNAIDTNRIVIIKGATGCGKTTQVPQFILDAAKEKDVHCNIVVTQPRRIAATSIATRVCKERGWTVGELVGYQIGLDRKGNEDTRILYVTTGVLLQKLIKDKDMKEYTHYIIDEIHERDQDMDFLLIVVRNFLNTRSPLAKLIVMSATMDTTKFYNYLVTYYNEKQFKPLVVDIDEPSPYKILNFFLDDLCAGKSKIAEAVTLLPFNESPGIQDNAYKTAARIIQRLDQVDQIDDDPNKAVLVFLPGLHEIEEMEKTLRELSSPEQFQTFVIRPLHSSITAEEQQKVFDIEEQNKRKIILSTNIAESSVTVPDIKYVIDFCLTKCLVTDPATGCTSLELMWASKSNLTQRAGRVGRVSDGRVYKMISKDFYNSCLEQDAVPEMLRCPLESLVLKAKLLEMGPPKKILALALDQPDLMNINQAVANLKEIGALEVFMENSEYDPCDGEMTFMGQVIAHLPLDIRLGKLIFLGNILNVTEECIVMACSMATKSMFSAPYGKHLEAYDAKLEWADSSCSDCIAFLNAYKIWRKVTTEGNYKRLTQFAKDNFLQLKSIKEISHLEDDIKRRLNSLKLYKVDRRPRPFQLPKQETKDIQNADKMRPFFLKLAIAGAFYPNYFVRGSQTSLIDENEALKVLGGNDPFSSVYLQGLPNNQPTVIYKQSIKECFDKIAGRLEVNVDNTSKAYVTFRRSLNKNQDRAIPGKIEMAVYRAIKMRQADVKFAIPRLKPEEATKIYEEHLTRNEVCDSELQRKMNLLVWPWKKVQKDDRTRFATDLLDVKISHVETPHKFWVQSSMTVIIELMYNMLKALNVYKILSAFPKDADLAIGSIHAAELFEDDNRNITVFHRCRIVSKKRNRSRTGVEYEYSVYFIDHGFSQEALPADNIYEIPADLRKEHCIDELPDFAQECSLVKLRPIGDESDSALSKMQWKQKACAILKSIAHQDTFAKIYSVVNDVLRIELVFPYLKDKEYEFKHTVNHKLILDNYAEEADEDCSSVRPLIRQKVMNGCKRRAVEDVFERSSKLIRRETTKADVKVLSEQDRHQIRKSIHEARMKLMKFYHEEIARYQEMKKYYATNNNSGEFYHEEIARYEEMKKKYATNNDTGDHANQKRKPKLEVSFDNLKLSENPDSKTKVFLKGPFSPLEMKLSSLTFATQGKLVKIERDSANSVLLDTDPSDPTERMVVAAFVGLNPSGERLNLKHTTIMPNVPALPTLCCLIFSPMVELRCNPSLTQYCGAICGLGYDKKTKLPFFPANDVAIGFDYEISDETLQRINRVRFHLNSAVIKFTENLEDIRQRLRTLLLELFCGTKYELQQTCNTPNKYKWGLIGYDNLRHPHAGAEGRHPADDDKSVYRLIWAIKRTGDEEREVAAVLNNLNSLELFVKGELPVDRFECLLCATALENRAVAGMHLNLSVHRFRTKRYRKKLAEKNSSESNES